MDDLIRKDDVERVRANGKVYKLPKVMDFGGNSHVVPKLATWRFVRYGAPKKGEYYVSGAIPQAYKAPNDLIGSYLIVEPHQWVKITTAYTTA
jgi:hypothetical protein